MTDRLGRTSLLVESYDEAIEFYRDRLGFAVLYDGELGDGTRIVHIGPSSDGETGLWLFEAESTEQRRRVGDQTGSFPYGVLYTDDCRGTYERLRANDVSVRGEPVETPDDVSVHFEDLYGNTFVLASRRIDDRRP